MGRKHLTLYVEPTAPSNITQLTGTLTLAEAHAEINNETRDAYISNSAFDPSNITPSQYVVSALRIISMGSKLSDFIPDMFDTNGKVVSSFSGSFSMLFEKPDTNMRFRIHIYKSSGDNYYYFDAYRQGSEGQLWPSSLLFNIYSRSNDSDIMFLYNDMGIIDSGTEGNLTTRGVVPVIAIRSSSPKILQDSTGCFYRPSTSTDFITENSLIWLITDWSFSNFWFNTSYFWVRGMSTDFSIIGGQYYNSYSGSWALTSSNGAVVTNNVQYLFSQIETNGIIEEDPDTVSIIFEAPDATSGTVPPSAVGEIEEDGYAHILLPRNTGNLTRTGWYWSGWIINGVEYDAGTEIVTDTSLIAVAAWSLTNPDYPGTTNPTGGGDGTFNDDSDTIDIPPNPNDILAANSGFSVWRLPASSLTDLSAYLFTEGFLSWLKLNWSGDYRTLVTSLTWLPIGMQIGTEIGGASEIYLGPNASGVYGNPVLQQYLTIRYDPLDVVHYWGNFLDYDPYTRLEIYLPFIGTREINIDLFVGYQIEVIYKIDVLTGSGLCFVSAIDGSVRHVLYTFPCSVGYQIPLGSDNFSSTKLKQGIIGAGAVVATGALIGSVATGGIPTAIAGSAAGASATAATSATAGSVALKAGGAAIGALMSNKSKFSQQGTLSDNIGALGTFEPYITITRPVQSVPQDFNRFYGYPSNTYQNLANLKGYTEIESIHLNGFTLTDSELEELRGLLDGGVIL